MNIQKLLEEVIKRSASDLHLTVGAMPTLRIDGSLVALEGHGPLNEESIIELVHSILTEEQKEILTANRELDFSFSFKDNVRFRVNAYFQKGYPAAALRLVSSQVKTIEELNLPVQLKKLVEVNEQENKKPNSS